MLKGKKFLVKKLCYILICICNPETETKTKSFWRMTPFFPQIKSSQSIFFCVYLIGLKLISIWLRIIFLKKGPLINVHATNCLLIEGFNRLTKVSKIFFPTAISQEQRDQDTKLKTFART